MLKMYVYFTNSCKVKEWVSIMISDAALGIVNQTHQRPVIGIKQMIWKVLKMKDELQSFRIHICFQENVHTMLNFQQIPNVRHHTRLREIVCKVLK